MKGKKSSAVLDPAPLRSVRPCGDDDDNDEAFELPEDWVVEEKTRPSSSSRPNKIDKCYLETSTGKRFRSLPAVELYLKGKAVVSTPTKPPRRQASEKNKKTQKNSDSQIVPLTIGSSEFVLPDGWTIEAHRRSHCNTVDKYYIEPETGRRFRSVIAVKRYLNGAGNESANETEPETEKKSSSAVVVKKRKTESGVESAVELRTPRSSLCSANFVLPDDWVIERHRRGGKKSSIFDKYYIEPGTGMRFRSLVSVERHLNEKEEEDEYAMPLKDFKHPKKNRGSRRLNSKSTTVSDDISCQEVSDSPPTKSEENPTTSKEVIPDNDSGPSEHSDAPKKTETEEETELPEAPKDDFGSPPSTVNWVLAGPAGDMWNPYLNEVMVPESTKKKWSETFRSSLHNDEDDEK